ncbi:MAG TPA: IPT/TIG domain-containing protein [Terracidiphilus sp.]|nr:IPT/TIG domain-containing protein [Terracidiphilus sp.]
MKISKTLLISSKVLLALIFVICITSPLARAATNLPFGQVTTGTISSAAQINHYTFSANTGDVISYTIVATGISPVIQVFVSGSATPFETGSLGYCNGNVLTMNTNGSVTLPASTGGTYDVWISDCSTTNTGSYSLYAQRLNNPSGASNLPLGQVTSGSIAAAAQSNTYTFTVKAGDYVNFAEVTSKISPQILIYNPDGSQFAGNNLGYCNGSVMEWDQIQFKTAGTYTALFDDCSHTNTGSYVVYFQRTNNPAGSISDVLWGQVQTGSVATVPQAAIYKFQGTAKDGLDFTIDATGFSPMLVLYNPDGSQLGADNLGYCNGSNLQWNGITLPSTGTYYLFVRDCSDTNTGTYTLSAQCAGTCLLPAPVVSSISPTSVMAGSSAFTLTVNGSNFVNVNANSVVQWNGVDLPAPNPATFKIGQLTVTVPATDVALAGKQEVSVFTPSPGGGTSNQVEFDVDNPKPATSSVLPISTVVGTCPVTLTITGSGFNSQTEVLWNGAALATTLVSATEVTAIIPCADLTVAGTGVITVGNPTPGGGTSSGTTFTIDNPSPVLSKISPQTITAGNSSATTVTLTGSGFVAASTADWNGAGLPTTYVSGTQLTASIPVSDTACGVAEPISVVNSTPGGGTSSSLTFTADNPVPTLTSISPTNVAAGSGSFTLTVNGSKFLKSCSVIQWNGKSLATTFVSATQLTATVPAADVASNGTANVTVNNPAPGGGTTAAQSFTIGPFPVPVLTSVSPTSTTAGGAAFTLTVNGSSFVQKSTVDWNGVAVTTTYVSATKLTAAIPASDIAAAGYIPITVFNPSPGGGTSGSQTFTVNNPLPKTTSLSPTSIPALSAKFTLTVNGSNFVSTSVVKWNTSTLVPTSVSATQLAVTVPASDIAAMGTASITVFNPTPGGGTSSPVLTFTIENPLAATPVISPAAGSYGYEVNVSISEPSSTPGATIYYTTDGTTPTTSSKVYKTSFLLGGPATVQAIAVAPNFTNSDTASSAFVIGGTPVVLAIPAASVTASGATLRAFVNGHDLAGQVWFLYGISSTALTLTTSTQTMAASTAGATFQAPLTGLSAGTTYYYQAVSTSPGGKSSSAILSFTTP